MLEFADSFDKKIMDRQYTYSLEKEKIIKDILFNQKQLPKFKHKVERIVTEDYIKIFYENNDWALIRFSGTEPLLRIYFEAEDENFINKGFEQIKSIL